MQSIINEKLILPSVEMDMNNRKSETSMEMKGFDITIEVSAACYMTSNHMHCAFYCMASGDTRNAR